jgi:hypothetical protein
MGGLRARPEASARTGTVPAGRARDSGQGSGDSLVERVEAAGFTRRQRKMPAAAHTSSFRRKPESTRTRAVAWPAQARAHVGQGGMAVIVDPGFRRDDDIFSPAGVAARVPVRGVYSLSQAV